MCKESIPVFLFVCFLKNISVTRSVLQLDNLVTWIRFKAFILLIVTSFVCVCVCACRRAYASCRSHVLYSLCYAEYWLGGR